MRIKLFITMSLLFFCVSNGYSNYTIKGFDPVTQPQDINFYLIGSGEVYNKIESNTDPVGSFGIKLVSDRFIGSLEYKNNGISTVKGSEQKDFSNSVLIPGNTSNNIFMKMDLLLKDKFLWEYDGVGIYFHGGYGFAKWNYYKEDSGVVTDIEKNVTLPTIDAGLIYKLFSFKTIDKNLISFLLRFGYIGRFIEGDVKNDNEFMALALESKKTNFHGFLIGMEFVLNSFSISASMNHIYCEDTIDGLTGTTFLLGAKITGDFYKI